MIVRNLSNGLAPKSSEASNSDWFKPSKEAYIGKTIKGSHVKIRPMTTIRGVYIMSIGSEIIFRLSRMLLIIPLCAIRVRNA